MSGYLTELNGVDQLRTIEEYQCALRNVIALALQKDRYSLKFTSKTASGEKIRALLKDPIYYGLVRLILGSTGLRAVRYRDLRQFVLGRNSPDYFSVKNRNFCYNIFSQNGGRKKSILQNNTPHFVARIKN